MDSTAARATGLGAILEIGVDADLSSRAAKHVRTTNVAAVGGSATLLFWFPMNFWTGETWVILHEAVIVPLLLGTLLWNRRGWHTVAACWALTIGLWQVGFGVWVGGFDLGGFLFYYFMGAAPYLALPPERKGLAHVYALLATLCIVAVSLGQGHLPQRIEVPIQPSTAFALNGLMSGLMLFACSVTFAAVVDRTERALGREQERSDRLLRNVLPESTAERLKAHPDEVIADRYDDVTVLFSDIVGFTPLSTTMSPVQTVALLNQVFTAFDRICEAEGVEKLRTIGDGYMAVAGAPIPREDHAQAMVRVAIAMRDHMARDPSCEGLEIRIGLNSGEVVGAIVGTSRFHFDVWGDAVNVAARMESTGEPGRIQIARATWERVRAQFPCESRGEIEVKGKGRMETWFVG